MQLQNTTQCNSLNFSSRFVRTKDLREAFNEARYSRDLQECRQFANAIKGVLRDGKNDVIRLSSKNNEGHVQVNGKLYNKNKQIT